MPSQVYLITISVAFAIASSYATPAVPDESSPVPEEPPIVGIQEGISSTTVKTTTGFQYALEPLTIPAGDCSNDTDIIDERQRGQDNYRVSLNGIKIIVAPASSLIGDLLMAEEMNKNKLGHQASDTNSIKEKPSISLQAEKQKRRMHLSLPWLLKNLNFRRPSEVKE